jgi:hypothetical protein
MQKLVLFACVAGMIVGLSGCSKSVDESLKGLSGYVKGLRAYFQKSEPLSLVTPKGYSHPTIIAHTTWEDDAKAKELSAADDNAPAVSQPKESFASAIVQKAQKLIAKVLPRKQHPLAKAHNRRRTQKGVLVHRHQKSTKVLAAAKNH